MISYNHSVTDDDTDPSLQWSANAVAGRNPKKGDHSQTFHVMMIHPKKISRLCNHEYIWAPDPESNQDQKYIWPASGQAWNSTEVQILVLAEQLWGKPESDAGCPAAASHHSGI